MSASCHITFVWRARLDIDDAVEEIGFPVLSAEVLMLILAGGLEVTHKRPNIGGAHSTDDILMISKMRFTCLTAVDLAAAEVGIVSQPHDAGPHGEARAGLI